MAASPAAHCPALGSPSQPGMHVPVQLLRTLTLAVLMLRLGTCPTLVRGSGTTSLLGEGWGCRCEPWKPGLSTLLCGA